jgi:hypothetical protein
MVPIGLRLLMRPRLDRSDHGDEFRRGVALRHDGKTRLVRPNLPIQRRVVTSAMADFVKDGTPEQILCRDLGAS